MYYGVYQRLGVHVGAPSRIVLAALYSRLKPEAMSRDNRTHRHAIARAVLTHHSEERDLYRSVMSGRVG